MRQSSRSAVARLACVIFAVASALTTLDAVHAKDERSLAETIEKARELIKAKQSDDALELLRAVSGKGPEEARRHFYMARAHGELGHYKEAIAENERAVALDPGLLDAHYNNACYAGRIKLLAEGMASLTRLADSLAIRGDAAYRARYRDLLASDADMTPFRAQPGFTAVSERITWGMPKAQYDALRAYVEVVGKTAAVVDDKKALATLKRAGLAASAVLPRGATSQPTGTFLEVLWSDPVAVRVVGITMPVVTLATPPRAPAPSSKKMGALPPKPPTPADVALNTGNQRDSTITRASLAELLVDPRAWMTRPDAWRTASKTATLTTTEDEPIDLAASGALLAVPKAGSAPFSPIFAWGDGASPEAPVLAVLATRDGTSLTVIDGDRDARMIGSAWGQRLFQNDRGFRRSLATDGKPGGGMFLVIEVPLKGRGAASDGPGTGTGTDVDPASINAEIAGSVENDEAMEDDGSKMAPQDVSGSFVEVGDGFAESGGTFERDPARKVRVTLHLYETTSTGTLDAKTANALATRLKAASGDDALKTWLRYLDEARASRP